MFPSMWHMRLINKFTQGPVVAAKVNWRGPIHSPNPLSRFREQNPKHKEQKAKTTPKQTQTDKTTHTKEKQPHNHKTVT